MTQDSVLARTERMRTIKDEVVNLKTSPLYAERIRNKVFPVIGEGSHTASIMFVGEAPGKNEAATGRPFVGAAGKVLDSLLVSIDIPRAEVYITNLVKDRPPGNRDPFPEEIALYAPLLDRQIDSIQPKVIATLGRHSMRYVMEKYGLLAELSSISHIHGNVYSVDTAYGAIKIIPLFHPAVAVYDPRRIEELKDDFKIVKNAVQ